ncbi:MAG: NAD(P)H-hydrate dehydratase, partial [Candidatus Nealsonbacteria bacterium CG01_land_8_20_14_3_00_12]
QAAAFINGRAGELAGKKLGESMTATDLIEEIPNVLPKF